MRGSMIVSLGVSALMIAEIALTAPTLAGPAYTKDEVLAFVKKTRGIHGFDDDPKPFDLLVTFDIDSANLTQQAKENLAEFAAAFKDPSTKGVKLRIEGYTDATGSDAYNLTLSDRRAAAVVAYLSSLKVDTSTIIAKGYGKSNLIVPDDPFSPKNRRVEAHLAE